jgi:hypothetical protein
MLVDGTRTLVTTRSPAAFAMEEAVLEYQHMATVMVSSKQPQMSS